MTGAAMLTAGTNGTGAELEKGNALANIGRRLRANASSKEPDPSKIRISLVTDGVGAGFAVTLGGGVGSWNAGAGRAPAAPKSATAPETNPKTEMDKMVFVINMVIMNTIDLFGQDESPFFNYFPRGSPALVADFSGYAEDSAAVFRNKSLNRLSEISVSQ
jgi:hypothetical protein